MFSLLHILGMFAIAATAVSASQPLPIPFTGPAHANPQGEEHFQDITIIQRQSDKTFFRISKSNSSGDGMSVATSPKFRGPWTYQYSILNELKEPYVTNRSDTDLWAPDVYFVNGLYYLFYSIHTGHQSQPPGLFDLCVATSKTLEADDWTDHGSMGVPVASDDQYVRLDSNVVSNSSNPSSISEAYMVWDSFHWGLYAMNITPDYLKAAHDTPKLLTADEYVPSPDGKHNRTECAYFLQHEKYTYLWYSQGSCCEGLHPDELAKESAYETFVCRSEDGAQGPYYDIDQNPCDVRKNGTGTVFLQNTADGQVFAPGSVGILSDPEEGGLVMWYQYYNLTQQGLGMQFGWNYLSFDQAGWPQLSETR